MLPLSIIGRGCRWDVGARDESRERWIVSSAYFDNPERAQGCAKIFQLHRPEIWEPGISALKSRLVIAYSSPGFEECERLPTAALLVEFGPIFASSISWMLAYALFLGYNDIEFHGVDMMGNGEYGAQRDYLFFLLGIARARGVTVKTMEYSGINMPPEIYGVEV